MNVKEKENKGEDTSKKNEKKEEEIRNGASRS